MRDFAGHPLLLRRLPLPSRMLYTLFLALVLVNAAVMAVMAWRRSGFTTAGVRNYYLGNEVEGVYGKSTEELLEVTHFHLFAMPVLLLILAHLFLLTPLPGPLKVAVIAMAFLGAALDVAFPWLLRVLSFDAAPLKNIARLLLAPSLLVLCIVPVWEMWRPSTEEVA